MSLSYIPALLEAMEKEKVRLMHNVAGFLGSDTVGCMVTTRLDQQEKLSLFIDICTNGDMLLRNKDCRIASSTAPGPNFERAKISCSMQVGR